MPTLRPVERTQVAAHHEGIGIARFQPQLAGVPFAPFGIEDVARLPHAIGQHHVDEQDHAGEGLTFAFPGTLVAYGAGGLHEQFINFPMQFTAGFKQLNVAAGFAAVIVYGFPEADDGLGRCPLAAEGSK